ncbi:MAG: penicillin-binding transpeptidase domain-containing protein [Sarcina sp.]
MAINKKKNNFTRFSMLRGIVAGLFTVIVLRLTYLQVFRYEDFKEKADTRSMRFVAEKAPRGKIYDANGNILATNKQQYIATFTETEASKEAFYRSMEIFLDTMKENNEEIIDKFDLRVNENGEIIFDFGFKTEENNKVAELRFKTDKGIFEEIQRELYPKQNEDLTDEQIQIIETELYKVTPKQMFYYLVDKYEMEELLIEFKDRDTTLSQAEDKKLRKSIKERYRNDGNKGFAAKIARGERIANDLVKEKTFAEIREFMVIKDAVKMQSFSGFKPVTIAPTISKDTAFVLYQKLNSLIGIDVTLEPIRYYPYEELGANFLGYMGAIPSANKEKYESRGYDLSTDLIGMAGIESAYEGALKGTKGGRTVKVNAEGRPREDLYSMQTTPGNNVHLTIDKDMQYSAEKMLKEQMEYLQGTPKGKNASRGAAVAIDVNSGDVLAMASYPSYNPNIFATGKMDGDVAANLIAPDLDTFGAEYIRRSGIGKTMDQLFPKDSQGNRQDPNDIFPKPMFNYATMGLLPPGSTFKPITALVALEEGVMNASNTISDGAVLNSARQFIKYPNLIDTPKDNAYHGTVSVKEALQKSCNSYFYEVAVKLYYKYKGSVDGFNAIAKYSWDLGLGTDPNNPDAVIGTGIEIAERTGSVYNFEGSKDKFKTFSMWDLVAGLEKGQLNSGNQSFTPVDIERNEKDSKELKAAKDELKDIVKAEIDKIESMADTGSQDEFKKNIEKALRKIYDNSEKYQANIKERKSDSADKLKVHFNVVSTEIWTWIQFNIKYQVVNAGNMASASIGQGDTVITPLQMVSAIATIANGGTRYDINMVDKITTSTGELVKEIEPSVLNKIEISQNTINLIKEGMYMTNHVQSGTAFRTFGLANFPIQTAGKTGTVTVKDDQEAYGRQPYSTYVSFAPVDKPEIAIFVVIYDGVSGGNSAIVARAIYETYFREQIKEIAPHYKPRTTTGEEYTYSLYPESEDYKDDGVFEGEKPPMSEEEAQKQKETANNDKKPESENNQAE